MIPASLLMDQHLLAENKEIPQLAGQFLKSLRSPNFNPNTLPKQFTLGTGHVRFFYRYGEFLRRRAKHVYTECLRRGFNMKPFEFYDHWKDMGPEWNKDFKPSNDDIMVSIERIHMRFSEKPNFYRYKGKPVEPCCYYDALILNKPEWIYTPDDWLIQLREEMEMERV